MLNIPNLLFNRRLSIGSAPEFDTGIAVILCGAPHISRQELYFTQRSAKKDIDSYEI